MLKYLLFGGFILWTIQKILLVETSEALKAELKERLKERRNPKARCVVAVCCGLAYLPAFLILRIFDSLLTVLALILDGKFSLDALMSAVEKRAETLREARGKNTDWEGSEEETA